MPDVMVQVENLHKQVDSPDSPDGKLVLLHDINFSIIAAEAVAVLGPSGSGKSTLLGLLAGLDTPSSGRIWLDGIDLLALDEDARADLRRDRVGFIFQSFQLLANLTALENVMLPLELAGRKDARERAREILSQVGLDNRTRHLPKQLSGGEQQRVAIARAFIQRPRILFADEPTGNLDRNTGERVIDLLFEMNQVHATTLIMVTHDEALAQRCNRRMFLDGGSLVGAPEGQS